MLKKNVAWGSPLLALGLIVVPHGSTAMGMRMDQFNPSTNIEDRRGGGNFPNNPVPQGPDLSNSDLAKQAGIDDIGKPDSRPVDQIFPNDGQSQNTNPQSQNANPSSDPNASQGGDPNASQGGDPNAGSCSAGPSCSSCGSCASTQAASSCGGGCGGGCGGCGG